MNLASIKSRATFFWLAAAISFLLFGRSLVAVFRMAWNVDEYTHILLVLPVSLGLIYLEGHGKSLADESNLLAGIPMAIAALALTWLGVSSSVDEKLFFTIVGLVLFWLALVLLLFGSSRFRAILFPLLFLLLLAPVPLVWLDRAIVFLQGASTDMTFGLFRAAGIPVFKNGFVLALPGLQIEVAKQCSGIRSSIMLLITALILGHLFLRSFRGQCGLAVLVIPFAVAKNAVRIFTLSILGMYVSRGFLEGRLHHEGGIVFFVLALGGLLLALQLIRRLEQWTLPSRVVTPKAQCP